MKKKSLQHGSRKAGSLNSSNFNWHALRASYVAGLVPQLESSEIVKCIEHHPSTKIMKYYSEPSAEAIRRSFAEAALHLTGKPHQRLERVDSQVLRASKEGPRKPDSGKRRPRSTQ